MVTDGRRGELLALRWFDVDLDAGVLEVRRNYVQRSGKGQEKDTKSHQMRRIALDPETVEVFTLHRRAFDDQVAQVDLPADDSAFVFSYVADHSRPCNPDAVTHRYSYRHSREMR
jgi:integrase